jgi:glycosyltransferase involved in cell wall biosynthesis
MTTVTVCIATIPGREHLLNRAASSVDAQRRKPDAVVVERDFWRTGAAKARNRALEKVDTEWIAWLDDDDELRPNHLAVLMREAVKDTSVDLWYPVPKLVTGTDPTAVVLNGRWVKPWGQRFTVESAYHIKARGSFIPITHLVRTSLVREIGGFPEGQTLPDGRYQGEDERYLINLLDAGAWFAHVNQVTWRWYGSHGSNTAGKAAS